jgi:hypothetical protein
MEYEIYKDENELCHWGIKGQRWGIRRYQNKDGSLTAAGKKKLAKEQAKVRQEEATLKNRQSVQNRFNRLEARKQKVAEGKKALDDPEAAKANGKGKTDVSNAKAKKALEEMSDKELENAVYRSRLESEYRKLNPEQTVEKQGIMKKFVNEAVVPAAMNAGKSAIENLMGSMVERITKGQVDPDSMEALTAVRDKLKLKNEIEKVKKGLSGKADDEINWSNMQKKREYDDETKAREEAAAKAKADEDARKANEARSKAQYDATYNNKGAGERTETGSSSSSSNALAIYNAPVSSLSKSSISSGKSAVYELLDSSGSSIMTFGDDDD